KSARCRVSLASGGSLDLYPELVRVGERVPEQRRTPRVALRLPRALDGPCGDNVPVRGPDRHDGFAPRRGRLHGHTRVAGPEASVSLADARDGAELTHRAPALLRPADALLLQGVLLGEDGPDGPGRRQRAGVPLQYLPHRGVVGL